MAELKPGDHVQSESARGIVLAVVYVAEPHCTKREDVYVDWSNGTIPQHEFQPRGKR